MIDVTPIQGAKAGASEPRRPVISKDTASSRSIVKITLGMTEGLAYGLVDGMKSIFLADTPLQNADGVDNFKNVTFDVRLGSNDQTYMKGFPDVSSETGVGVTLREGTPWIKTFTDTQLSALRVRLKWNRLAKTNPDNGDVSGHKIDYAIDLQVDGQPYKTVLDATIQDKLSSGYERTHRVDLPRANSSWTIRVRRITPNSTSEYIQDDMQIEAVAEVIDVKMTYPNTAYIGLGFDAESFSSIPKMSALMRGVIIRVPSNYNAETRTYAGIWDGTFKYAYTNNPAWIYYDICTHKRYGIGDRITSDMVDKWSLYSLGQYCDQLVPDGQGGMEPRFTCNVYLQKQATAYEVLQHIAGIFRALSFWDGERIVVDADLPQDPVYTFTRANVINGDFEYAGARHRDRHTIARVAWDNPDNAFETEYEYVRNEKAMAKYGKRTMEVAAFGCTSRGQAQRQGHWALLTEELETRQVTFSVGLDGFIPRVGNVINVSDELYAGRANGGRVSKVNTAQTVITIDRDNVVVNIGDTLVVNGANGASQRRKVKSVKGRNITTTTAFKGVEAESVWAIDAPDLFLMRFRVISSKLNDDNTFTITGLQNEPQKHAAVDLGANVEPTPISVNKPPNTINPPDTVDVSATHRTSQGQTITTLVIAWTQVKEAVRYAVEWRKGDGMWTRAPRATGTSVDVEGIYSGIYQARVVAISAFDIESPPRVSQAVNIAGKAGTPPKLTSLVATGILLGMDLKWTFAKGSEDTAYTEIEVASAPDTNVKLLAHYAYNTNTASINGLQGYLTQYYRGRIVDKLGNKSPWTGWVKGVTDGSADKIMDIIQGEIDLSSLTDALGDKIGQIDINSSAIDAETQARINAINAVDESIAVENRERIAAVKANADKITAEAAARAAALATANANLVAEQQARAAAILDTNGRIVTEQKARAAAILDTNGRIVTEQDARVFAINALSEGITSEINKLKTADSSTLTKLDAAVVKLNDNIAAVATEVTARTTADTALGQRIDTVTTKANGNTTAITNEVTARTTADTALGQRIDTVTTKANGNTTAIQTEVTARSTADTALGQRIDTVTTTAGGNSAAIVTLNKATSDNTQAVAQVRTDLVAELGKGKNLYNYLESVDDQYINHATGTFAGSAVHVRSTFIDIIGGLSYTISTATPTETIDNCRVVFYNADKQRITGSLYNGATVTVDAPAAAKYMAFSAESRQDQYTRWMLAQSAVALPWTPALMAVGASITNEATTRATADESLGQQISTVVASNGANATAIQQEVTARTTADTALGQRIDTVTTKAGANSAAIVTLTKASADNEAAIVKVRTDMVADYNALTIGGTNLLLNSSFSKGVSAYGAGVIDQREGLLGLITKVTNDGRITTFGLASSSPYRKTKIVSGRTYTLSFWGRGSITELNYIYLMRLDGGNTRIPTVQMASDINTRYSVTFVAPWSTETAYIMISGQGYPTAAWFEVGGVKLEEGNKATSWSPAPQDIDAEIDVTRASITSEATTRADADGALSTRIDTVTATAGANKSSITSEITARTTADNALSARIDTVTTTAGANKTSITNEVTARANADTALGQRIDTVTTANGSNTTAITNEVTARTSADTALGQRIDTVTTKASGNTTAITNEVTARTTADTALGQRIDTVTTKANGNSTAISTEVTARTTADTALGQRIDAVSATASGNTSSITSLTKTVSDNTQAVAKVRTDLTADFNGIQIGGRNLLAESGFTVETDAYMMKDYPITDSLVVGEIVTCTIWGELNSAKTHFAVYNTTGSGGWSLSEVATGVWRATFPWRINEPNNRLRIYHMLSSTTAVSKIYRVKLERGNRGTDWTESGVDLYTGMLRGKNLYDSTTVVADSYLTYAGLGTSAVHKASDFIEVLPNSDYTVSVDAEYGGFKNFRMMTYDANKNYITYILLNTDTSYTIKTPPNARYMRISGGSRTDNAYLYWVVTYGSTALKWTPSPQAVGAAFSSEATTRATADEALSNRITTAQSKADSAFGKITTAETTIASNTAAIAQTRSDLVSSYSVKDTRNTDELPSYYYTNYPKQTVYEFKRNAVLVGVVGVGSYVSLETVVKWSDASGGSIIQTAVTDDNRVYIRTSASATAWKGWLEQEDVVGSAAKVAAAKALLDNRINATNANLSSLSTTVANNTQAIATTKTTLTADFKNYTDSKTSGLSVGSEAVKLINPASISVTSSTFEGYLVIETPIVANRMVNLSISGYNYYSGNSTIALEISFYVNTGGFYNYDFVSNGSFDIPKVQLGWYGSADKAVVIIGLPTTQWRYPKVMVDSALIGHNSSDVSLSAGWTMSMKTSLSGYTNLTDVTGVNTQKALTNNTAAIQSESVARASALGALASTVNTLQTTTTNNTALRHFQMRMDWSNWTNYVGDGELTTSSANGMIIGNNSGDDQRWMIRDENIPLLVGVVYRITARYRNVSGAGTTYVGVAGVASNGTTLVSTSGSDSYGGQHYIGTDAAVGGWKEITGYIAAAGTDITGLSNVRVMHGSSAYFRPLLIANYSRVAGQTYFEYFKVETVDKFSSASIEESKTSIDGINAQYTLKLDVGGRVSGYGLISSTTQSEFAVAADRFWIAPPTGTSKGKSPFMVLTSTTTINGVSVPAGTYMQAAFIHNGAIDIAKINKASITSLSALSADIGTLTTTDSRGTFTYQGSKIVLRDSNGRLLIEMGLL